MLRRNPKKWKCQQCGKKYESASMRNAILHASAHNNKKSQESQKHLEKGDARTRIHTRSTPKNTLHTQPKQKPTREKNTRPTTPRRKHKQKNKKQETIHHKNTPWETLGYIRKEQKKINGETQTTWHCCTQTCNKTSNNPNNLAKHVVKAHNVTNIRLSRQKVNCPFCNKEYSNAITLLTHLEMRTAKMTWQPKT